jgi:MHS family proline/betaine transporter-like MFS transporter
LYGHLSPILATLFFPSEDALTSLMATFGVFAAGFLMRPLGAVAFGHLGDRLGRKKALVLSVALMAVPTGLIGLLPTYAQAGSLAAVLLVVLRLLQGFSVGGEFTGSIIFLVERTGDPCSPGLYMMLGAAVTVGVVWLIRETYREPLR